MNPLGDRRSRARFDVVGALWGVLELTESARIRNVSNTGALIDSPLPVALESTQTVRVIVNGEPVAVEVIATPSANGVTANPERNGEYPSPVWK